MSAKIHQKFPSLIHSIFYIIPVEDGDPYEASVMQGFSRSLMSHSWIIQFINTLPSDIIELTPEGHKHRVVRRMSGATPIHWHGQSPKALGMMTTPEFTPFTVLCLGQKHKIDTYREWIDSHTFPLTVIAKEGGTISYENFSIDALKKQFLTVCDAIEEKVEPKAIQEARSAISSWSETKTKKLGYQVGGHNSIYPNCAALDIAGFSDVIYGPFEKIQQGIDPYVEQIRKTSESIFDLRDTVSERSANEFLRPPPDLNFFAPSIYPFFKGIPISTSPLSVKEKKRFTLTRNALERQMGYMFEASTEAQAKALFGEDYENGNPEPNFIFMERAAELRLASNAVGSLAASELSCVARLPNSANRTKGRVRLFAENYRSRKTNARKRFQSFKAVQKAITESVPDDLLNLIDRSKYGIRLISDAHLEWLEYNGLPLCLQKDVSRIPTTPGNLLLSQLGAKPALHLSMDDFSEVLIINAIKTDDPISPLFDIALDAFSNELKGKIQITKKKVGSRDEL